MTTDDRAREPIIDSTKRFNKEKRKLRMVYKHWKAGMVRESDLSPKHKRLLMEYYGIEFRRKKS